MKSVKSKIKEIEINLKYHEDLVAKMKQSLRELKQEYFIQNAIRPIYDYKNFKDKKFDKNEMYETETEWWDTGTISDMTHKNVSIWVCKYCKTPIRRKYIATGHDHTDYSYEICDCAGAKKNGKHWDKLD